MVNKWIKVWSPLFWRMVDCWCHDTRFWGNRERRERGSIRARGGRTVGSLAAKQRGNENSGVTKRRRDDLLSRDTAAKQRHGCLFAHRPQALHRSPLLLAIHRRGESADLAGCSQTEEKYRQETGSLPGCNSNSNNTESQKSQKSTESQKSQKKENARYFRLLLD